jgi:hypothetical protein
VGLIVKVWGKGVRVQRLNGQAYGLTAPGTWSTAPVANRSAISIALQGRDLLTGFCASNMVTENIFYMVKNLSGRRGRLNAHGTFSSGKQQLKGSEA